jgi:hypothetical protein
MCSQSHCKAETGRNSIGPCRILKRFRSTGVLADVARLDTVEVRVSAAGPQRQEASSFGPQRQEASSFDV